MLKFTMKTILNPENIFKMKHFSYFIPKAYRFLRGHFLLPHPKSLSIWSSNICVEPGLLADIMDHLKNKSFADERFRDLSKHDVETAVGVDLHSNQLQKEIIKQYLSLRLRTHGKKYKVEVIKGSKVGKRQQTSKLLHFQNL